MVNEYERFNFIDLDRHEGLRWTQVVGPPAHTACSTF